MRLQMKAGAKVVRASARAVVPVMNSALLGGVPLAAISPTGKTSSTVALSAKEPLTRVEPAGVWLSAPQTTELPLPDGTEGEVLIDLNRAIPCGFLAPMMGALIDDLRVE